MNGLPEHRQALTGRTTNCAWDPAAYGSAIERPSQKHRVRDLVFGGALAVVVALTAWVLLAYGSVPA